MSSNTFRSVNSSSAGRLVERLEDRVLMSADVGLVLGSLLSADDHGASETIYSNLLTADHGLVLDGGGSFVFEEGLIVTGDLVLTHADSVVFKGGVSVTGNVIINAGQSIIFGSSLTAGGAVALASDEVDFLGGAGSASIAGDISLSAFTIGSTVEVGFDHDSATSLSLTDSDLSALHVGGRIEIGKNGLGGLLVVDSAEFQNDVTLAGSDVTVQGSLIAHGSDVALTASDIHGAGIARNDGLIDVSAQGSGTAGSLILSGVYAGNFGIVLAKGSSTTAGGSVSLQSTKQTLVSSSASIDASGGTLGGSVVLWSDNNTTMAGDITARGGAAGGNGGFVEVSSAGGFSLTGHVDTTAVAGKTGTLLIDPKNVIIAATGAALLTGVDQFSATPDTNVTIAASTITTAATGVTIQANNDIIVNAALNMSQDLTLLAGRSVLLNESISLTNKSLTIVANDDTGVDLQRDSGEGSITALHGVSLSAGSGTIDLKVEAGDAGPAGGVTIDRVSTTGTLNITAGFVHETTGDTAPAAGSMTSEDDLSAGVLNLVITSTDGGIGEAPDQGNGALEVSAGVINANVLLAGGLPASDFVGHIVLADVDHTNGSAGGILPSVVNAPMTIGTINVGSGTVVLQAKGGSILGAAGVTPNITAMQVNLTTEAGVGGIPGSYFGSIGTSAGPLRTDVGMLTATASDGGVFISEANSVMINKIIAQEKGVSPQTGANGTVVVVPTGGSATNGTSDAVISAGGDMVILDLKAADRLTLTAGGIIADGNQDNPNIMARDLVMTAGGSIGNESDTLETTVMSLQATTTDGGVFISEADGANVSSVTAGGTGNDITITSGAGSLVIGALTAVGGDVTVKASFESITDGNGGAANITAGTATLEARTGLGSASDALEVNVSGLSTKVGNNGAGTYVANSGSVSSLSIETNNGAVGITLSGGSVGFVQPGSANQLSLSAPAISSFAFANAGGSVAINSINAGTGSVSITAKTSIEDHANDSVLDIRGGAVTLKAGTTIGTTTNALETDLDSLTATADAGGVFISDAGSITSLTATAKGAGNAVSVNTTGDLAVAKAVAPGAITLNAGGNLTRIGGVMNVSGASATLQAGGAIGTAAEPLVLGINTLTSATAAAGGGFLRGKGSLTATSIQATGDVELSVENNLTLGLVQSGAANAVKITSAYGSILDGNNAAVNVRGGSATLTAVQIGTSTDAIETEIGTLAATGSSGGVYVSELNDLTVTRVEAQGLGANIGLTAGGNISLGVLKADGDKVNLKSTSGSISDGNGSALNITADQLDISAPGGVSSLQNSVNKLGSANGGSAGITISNIGALAITDATLEGKGATRLTIQADTITVLDMADNVAAMDPNGSVELITAGNIIFLDPNDTILTSGSGSIKMSAGVGITPAYPDTGSVISVGNLTTTGGSIDVRANHHITIGTLNAGSTGNVTVVSETGVLLDGNGAATNVIGNLVTLAGSLPSLRTAELESTIRIADYSAIRSEAAAKLTNAQSLAAATAIMNVQQQNALSAKQGADSAMAEAEADQESKDTAALASYIVATALDGVATALGIARDIVAIPAGAAQAIPFTGDGGAMTGYSALDVAANVADVAAFAAGVVADQLGDIAEEAANETVRTTAEFHAFSATYEDSLATWRAFNEARSIAQTAADAAAIARDHALVVRDQAIMAEDQSNVIGTSGSALQIQANQVDVHAYGGSVFLAVTGNTNLGDLTTTGADSSISVAATGSLAIAGTVKAPAHVNLAAGGSINHAGGMVEAAGFLGMALGSIGSGANPLHTLVQTLALQANGGGVGILNTGALSIGAIGNASGVTATGLVAITSSGDLTTNKGIAAAGQTVTLVSQTGSIIDSNADGAGVTASALNATAAQGITLDTAVAQVSATVTGAGSLTLREADGITLASLQTANGAISVSAGGTIAANSVVSLTDANTNDISLVTTGGDIQAGVINAGVNAGDVSLQAGATGSIFMFNGGRITADSLLAKAGAAITATTTAKTLNMAVSDAGAITVTELDSVSVDALSTTNGSVGLSAGGKVTLSDRAVNAGAGNSDVNITAAGAVVGPMAGNGTADIIGAIVNVVTTGAGSTIGSSSANPLEIQALTRVNASTQNSSAFVEAIGDIVVGNVQLGSGDLHLKALAGSITAAAAGNGVADIVAAHVDLAVTGQASRIGGGEGRELEFNANTLALSTEGGSAFVADTNGGVAVNALNVGAGDLFVTAMEGAITDNNGAANNVTATNVMLSASQGVGTAANALEVSVNAIEASGGAGGVNVSNGTRDLFLGGVTNTLSGIRATAGDITISTQGGLTVNESVTHSAAGNVRLTTVDSTSEGDDVTVNANITTGGTITIEAGDDVVLAAGVTGQAGGIVAIHGDHGDIDAGAGVKVFLNGAIRADRLEVTTGDDGDLLEVRDVVVASSDIAAGAGNDIVVITAGNTLGNGTVAMGAGNDHVTLFTAVENVSGGEGDDTVLVKAGASITGQFDGGAGHDAAVYDHDQVGGDDFAGPVTVDLQARAATLIGSFTALERFEATNDAGDHLVGADATNTWHITGKNRGDIGGAGTLEFVGFEHLTGGANDDSFQFAAGGEITGNLDGAGHQTRDTIDYNAANFDAGINTRLDIANGGFSNAIGGRFDRIDEVIGDADYIALNAFTGNNAANSWSFTSDHSGEINGLFRFGNFGKITGGNAGNTFAFADGSLPTKPVIGGAGNNTLDLSAWSSDLRWNITGDNSGTVVTAQGSFEFSGMSTIIGGSGNDRFVFSNDRILGKGLLAPGALDGGAGTDFLDLSDYTTPNLWSRTDLDGSVKTDRGTFAYSSIEQFLGSQTTTFRFDVADFIGSIGEVTMPSQVLPTKGGGVKMTVTNNGNDEAIGVRIDVSYFLSVDDTIDAGDVLVGKAEGRLVSLFPGSTRGEFFTATMVPAGTAPGNYRLLVFIDSGNAVSEADESNNVIDAGAVEVLPVQVDLTATGLKESFPDEVLPGAKANLTATVKNVGNWTAIGKADVEYFLSLDGTIDANDIALGGFTDTSINLAAGASRTFAFNAQIPAGTPVGDYQILMRVDGKDTILESNDGNNAIGAATGVRVNEAGVDLVAGVQPVNVPDLVVPNDMLRIQVPIKNIGNIAMNGKIDVDIYLSVDANVDSSDVLLKSLNDVSISLAPNGERILTATAPVPTSILGGTFYFVADVDSHNDVAELNEGNNTGVSGDVTEVVWRFGNFGDRRGVKLVVPDTNGTMVTFSMIGEGAGDVIGGSEFTEISLVGTNEQSRARITSANGETFGIGRIHVVNPMYSIFAPHATVNGDVDIDGSAHGIHLGSVNNSNITIGVAKNGSTVGSLIFYNAENVSVTSATPLRSLVTLNWIDTDATPDLVQAPWLGRVKSTGSFQADIVATDSLAGVSLQTFTVLGETTSNVLLNGSAGLVDLGGWIGGSLTASAVKSLTVRGDMVGSHVSLTGAGLAMSKQALGTMRVTGAVSDSVIDARLNAGSIRVGTWGAGSVLAVGVGDGGDGTFFDGNEVALGAKLGQFVAASFVTGNGGTSFGFAVDALTNAIRLNGSTAFTASSLPTAIDDLKLAIV